MGFDTKKERFKIADDIVKARERKFKIGTKEEILISTAAER